MERLTLRIDNAVITVSELSVQQKVMNQQLWDAVNANPTLEAGFLALGGIVKCAVKSLAIDNKTYLLKFNGDEISDECFQLLMFELIANHGEVLGKLGLIYISLMHPRPELPTAFYDNKGQKIEGVEVLSFTSKTFH
jgi:hypothetical protein